MSPESFIDLAPAKSPPPSELPDLEASARDFKFRLEDPVAMLPADELFSDGKLVPLQLSLVKPQVNNTTISEIRLPESPKTCRRPKISSTDLSKSATTPSYDSSLSLPLLKDRDSSSSER
nr:hypothetical protein CFP56_39355 [Quercus suber]